MPRSVWILSFRSLDIGVLAGQSLQPRICFDGRQKKKCLRKVDSAFFTKKYTILRSCLQKRLETSIKKSPNTSKHCFIVSLFRELETGKNHDSDDIGMIPVTIPKQANFLRFLSVMKIRPILMSLKRCKRLCLLGKDIANLSLALRNSVWNRRKNVLRGGCSASVSFIIARSPHNCCQVHRSLFNLFQVDLRVEYPRFGAVFRPSGLGVLACMATVKFVVVVQYEEDLAARYGVDGTDKPIDSQNT